MTNNLLSALVGISEAEVQAGALFESLLYEVLTFQGELR